LGLGFSSDSFEPGIGMEKSKVLEPVEITHLKGQNRIIKIYCGGTFSLFQTDKGDLFGCGMNDLGQLGLDTYMEELLQLGGVAYGAPPDKVKRGKHQQTSTDVTVPTKIICFQGIPLHNLACGENHALAISGDDKNMLWAWGMYR
jgi:alpha-tubulin suppressor-like RCC1 family protein